VVTAWLAAQPQAWRRGIIYVAIDLSASYTKALREGLPHAVLVTDRFHVIHLANGHHDRRASTGDPRAGRTPRSQAFAKMWNALADSAGQGKKILHTHVVKEELRTLLTLFSTHPERHLARRAQHKYYASAPAPGAPETHRLAGTIETWWPAIEATTLTGHTNARTEGHNRLAKHEGRNASGYHNPTNQHRHIRWACTQHRQVSVTTTELPGQVR
jgi:transposase